MESDKRYIEYNNEMESIITCPIYRTIMCDPVVASDGITYERDAIETWFENNNISPMTGLKISKTLNPSVGLKNIITTLTKLYPELLEQQYKFTVREYSEARNAVKLIIKNAQYSKLKQYIGFDFFRMSQDINLCDLFKSACDEILMHLIDNRNKYVKSNNVLIKHIICYSSFNVIKYLVSKKIYIRRPKSLQNKDKTENKDIKREIHHVFSKRNDEIVKFFIDLGFNLELKHKGTKPIHFLCKNENKITLDTFKRLIDKGIDLESKDSEGNKPIHYLCHNYEISANILKIFIDKGIDLESKDSDDNKPIHILCMYSHTTVDTFKIFIDKGIDLESRNSNGYKPIHYLCEYGNNDTLTYFLDLNISLGDSNNYGIVPFNGLINSDISNDTIIKFIDKDITNSFVTFVDIFFTNIKKYDSVLLHLLHKNMLNLDSPVTELISNRSNRTKIKTVKNGWFPIHYICASDNTPLILEFINKCVDLNRPTPDGLRPIHLLAKPSTISALAYILQKDVTIIDHCNNKNNSYDNGVLDNSNDYDDSDDSESSDDSDDSHS